MPIVLEHKSILLISPQPWGEMHISKHHYAIELARRFNTVYFLNPLTRTMGIKKKLQKLSEYTNIYTIDLEVPLPYLLKFHCRELFQKTLNLQIRTLLRQHNLSFDIVWDFDCGSLFYDLGVFNGKLNIFHPVDSTQNHKKKFNVDIVFSVSPEILKQNNHISAPKYFINHGLGGVFYNNARSKLSSTEKQAGKTKNSITVGYIGNLLIPAIDRDVFKNIIIQNSQVHFKLVGPFTPQSGNGSNSEQKFILFLKNQTNVELVGPKGPEELHATVCNCDIFLLCYRKYEGYFQDNSHKVLEYLSTGKVVVSSYLSVYEDKREIIQMLEKEQHLEDLLPLLEDTIRNIAKYNNPVYSRKRIQYALANSYANQVNLIEKKLNELC